MLAGAAALGGDRRRSSHRGRGGRQGLNRLPRIEKQVLVTLRADSRART
jgi:hypothetical protein